MEAIPDSPPVFLQRAKAEVARYDEAFQPIEKRETRIYILLISLLREEKKKRCHCPRNNITLLHAQILCASPSS